MASVKRLFGKFSFGRALRFTARQNPPGRAAVEAPGFLEVPKKLSARLAKLVAEADKRERPPKRAESWKRMLALARELSKYVGARPTHAQALAALALRHGLEGEELAKQAYALNSLDLRARKMGAPLVENASNNRLDAVAKGGLAKALRALEGGPAVQTTKKLSAKTGLGYGELHSLLTTLEAMKLAARLPIEKMEGGGREFRWTARRLTSHETKPKLNPAYQVMKALQGGEKSFSDFVRPTLLKRVTLGKGVLNSSAARNALSLLQAHGVIEEFEKPVARRRIAFYRLTPAGAELIREQEARNSIHPRLREIMLSKPPKLKVNQQRRLKALIEYIRIRREYEAIPRKKMAQRGKVSKLAERHGITVRRAYGIAQLRNPPWAVLSTAALKRTYMPLVRANSPEEARWLEDNLEDFREQRAARLFEENIGLAYKRAGQLWKWMGWKLKNYLEYEYEDWQQEALLELRNAASAWDPKKGKLSTVAYTYITNKFKELLHAAEAEKRARKTVSLSQAVEGRKSREEPLSAKVEDKASAAPEAGDLKRDLLEIISGLNATERGKRIVIERFGLESGVPKTLVEVGKMFGVTYERIRQLEAKMLEKLGRNPKARALYEMLGE